VGVFGFAEDWHDRFTRHIKLVFYGVRLEVL